MYLLFLKKIVIPSERGEPRDLPRRHRARRMATSNDFGRLVQDRPAYEPVDEKGAVFCPFRPLMSHRRPLWHTLAQVAHDIAERGRLAQQRVGPLAQAFEFPG